MKSDEVWPGFHTLCSPAKQGAADPSSLRESRRAAGLTEEKREERREQREGRREKREEKRMNIITDLRKESKKREENVWKSEDN